LLPGESSEDAAETPISFGIRQSNPRRLWLWSMCSLILVCPTEPQAPDHPITAGLGQGWAWVCAIFVSRPGRRHGMHCSICCRRIGVGAAAILEDDKVALLLLWLLYEVAKHGNKGRSAALSYDAPPRRRQTRRWLWLGQSVGTFTQTPGPRRWNFGHGEPRPADHQWAFQKPQASEGRKEGPIAMRDESALFIR
jgi:hypothetical protein